MIPWVTRFMVRAEECVMRNGSAAHKILKRRNFLKVHGSGVP